MKQKNRIRLTKAEFDIVTRDDAEDAMAAISSLTLQRNATQILLDENLGKVRATYGPEIAECEARITAKSERLQVWAEANPDEFPKGKKSIEMNFGTLGYRTGTPKLKTLGRITWAKVLEKIRAAGILDWIRTEESVNKERIIGDARGACDEEVPRQFINDKMRQVGVQVVQTESFFIEPKIEELTNRITEAALL